MFGLGMLIFLVGLGILIIGSIKHGRWTAFVQIGIFFCLIGVLLLFLDVKIL